MRTRGALREALIGLILEKGYDAITVDVTAPNAPDRGVTGKCLRIWRDTHLGRSLAS